ncbi:MAG: hypothetical protein FJX47_01535 [Alphaproteobacteria bacterium]|nr:hypothetical protein [Alphaproteobacteria bacterium]
MTASAESLRLVRPPREGLCLDFANTRYWRGSAVPTEDFPDLAAVLAWCRTNVPPLGASPKNLGPEALARARELREGIYAVFFAIAQGEKPKPAALAGIGEGAEQALRLGIARDGEGFAWRVRADPKDAIGTMLAPVLWSAWDLLVSPRLGRLRHCANDACLWLFLDDSKSGTRRWCSMAACGNRAKAHRHYFRHKKA